MKEIGVRIKNLDMVKNGLLMGRFISVNTKMVNDTGKEGLSIVMDHFMMENSKTINSMDMVLIILKLKVPIDGRTIKSMKASGFMIR